MNKLATLLVFSLLMALHAGMAFASLAIQVDSDQDSAAIFHGDSTQVTFTVQHSNTFCAVFCDYGLLDYGTGQILSTGSKTISASNPQATFTYTVTAPSKQEGGIGGHREYLFRAECRDSGCLTSDTDSEEKLFTLNYGLNPSEKAAQSYLSTNLKALETELTNAESEAFKIQTRIERLPANVKIRDLQETRGRLSDTFQEQQRRQERVTALYDALDFLTGREEFGSSWLNDAQQLNMDLRDLNEAIDARVKYHNRVAQTINQLDDTLSKLSIGTRIFSREKNYEEIATSISALSVSFEQGNFDSYEVIEQEAAAISERIVTLQQEIATAEESLKTQILQQVSEEKQKACTNEGCSLSTPSTGSTIEEFLKQLCQKTAPQLNTLMEKTNLERQNSYERRSREIEQENTRRNAYNEVALQLNADRQRIFTDIANNDLTVDLTACPRTIETTNTTQLGELKEKCALLKGQIEAAVHEKEKSVFFKLKRFFKKLFNSKEQAFSSVNLLELLTAGTPEKTIEFSTEYQKNLLQYCNIDLNTGQLNHKTVSEITNPEGEELVGSSIQTQKEHETQCCTFGTCRKCCEGNECLYDEKSYPIIFLHGHSFKSWDAPEYSLDAFNGIRDELLQNGIRIGGTITPTSPYSSVPAGDWGKSGNSVSIKMTYYYGVYDNNGKLIAKPSKEESISTYASRLKDAIELTKYRTNRAKVIIIAHSMGGLVAREYINLYGAESVDKLIMVGTPNHGIYGSVDDFCSWVGANLECQEMSATNEFIRQLNADETPGNTKYYTITGQGCILSGIDGDGIVRTTSVPLDGATNYPIKGTCAGFTNRDMHSDLLDPTKYPEVTSTIVGILKQ